MLAILFGFKKIILESLQLFRNTHKLILLSLFVLIFLSVIVSENKVGVTLWWAWVLFNAVSIIFIRTLNLTNESIKKIITSALVINVAIGIGQFSLYEFFGFQEVITKFHYYGGTPRLTALSYHPNFYAISLCLYLACFFGLDFKEQILKYLLITASTLVIALTTAKSGVAGVILILLAVVIQAYMKKNLRIPSLAFAFIGLTIGYAYNFKANNSQFKEITHINPELGVVVTEGFSTSSSQRATVFAQGLNIFFDYPIMGIGLRNYKNFTESLPVEQKQKYLADKTYNLYFSHLENAWQELLVEGGLILFVPFFLVVSFFVWKIRNEPFFISVILYFGFFTQIVQNINYLLPYLVLGFALVNVSKRLNNNLNKNVFSLNPVPCK